MARDYATKLTKEDLIRAGIKNIYYDPDEPRYHVIGNDGEEISIYKGRQDYLFITLYYIDSNGNRIKNPIRRKYKYKGRVKEIDSYNYKSRPMNLSRVAWAWFYGEVPEGLVCDHIDNKHTTHYDNRLDNLQLITQEENQIKERPVRRTEIPCNMTKPIQYYIEKYNYWLMEYANEKEERDSQTRYACNCRNYYCNYKKKIRYWYKHKAEWEEYNRLETAKLKAFQYQQQRRNKINQYKQEIKQAKEISKELWHKKLQEYKEFLEKFPFQQQEELEKLYLSELA